MVEMDGVVPALGQALLERGYTNLTPVQQAVVGHELGEADALVSAQTGSGKTVAFGLALAPTLLGEAPRFTSSGAPLALIVAPTRELALQIKREFEWLYQHTGATLASCVGGMDMRTERNALFRGSHIVIGTPGRLRDHLQRGSFDPSSIRAVVLDEADEMLDLGFREDLEFLLDALPEERRTLLFSATVPRAIGEMAQRYQRDAVRIETAGEAKQHLDITYRALRVASGEKENAIINVLRFYEAKNALVFCNTRAGVNHMTARLNNRGFSVVALSGELSQSERTQALQAMRDGRARICIATDVAARGIDLPNLDLVIHADLPSNPETLLHRSGRTGRAGRKGVSALMVLQSGRSRAERLLHLARIDATWDSPPSAEAVTAKDSERLLKTAVLEAPAAGDEEDLVRRLLAQQSAEDIATAFVRLHRAEQSAPEELQVIDASRWSSRRSERDRGTRSGERGDRGDRGREPRGGADRHRGFDSSVWYSLSVGRKQNAEPRWLIPMLCKSTGITKHKIGAIKMHATETHVELDARCVEQFQQALGANGKLEKNIRAARLETAGGGQPAAPKERPERPRSKPDRQAEKPRPPRARMPEGAKPEDSKPTRPKKAPVPPQAKPSEDAKVSAGAEADGTAIAEVRGPNRKERRLAKFGPPRGERPAEAPSSETTSPADAGTKVASNAPKKTSPVKPKNVAKRPSRTAADPNAPRKRKAPKG